MKATRTPIRELGTGQHPQYVCARCGIIRVRNAGRTNTICKDCRDVEWDLANPRQPKQPRQTPNREKTHCKNGHPLTGSNLYLPPDGKRRCRECKRARARAWHARKKAQAAA